MQHPRFRSGAITTGFIAEEYPEGFEGAPVPEQTRHDLIAVAAAINAIRTEREQMIDGQLNGNGAVYGEQWVVQIGHDKVPVTVESLGDRYIVSHGGQAAGPAVEHEIETLWRPGDHTCIAKIDGRAVAVQTERRGVGFRLIARGAAHDVRVLTPRAAELSAHMIEKVPPDLSKYLLCPMPGLVVSINVRQGDRVEAGQPLAIVEAMKMENILRAEKAATVGRIAAKAGESLAVDAVILEFE
jgi:propionyl-CoA carboxylase alpha chain